MSAFGAKADSRHRRGRQSLPDLTLAIFGDQSKIFCSLAWFIEGSVGATSMASALLKNLMTGAGSGSQLIGGIVVALLYAVIGLLSAIGSILILRRIFHGRCEQIFWASFLGVIAAFYLSFAAYFGASTRAWQTEGVVVVVFFFVLWLDRFSDLLSRSVMSCMGFGTCPIVCPARHLQACR